MAEIFYDPEVEPIESQAIDAAGIDLDLDISTDDFHNLSSSKSSQGPPSVERTYSSEVFADFIVKVQEQFRDVPPQVKLWVLEHGRLRRFLRANKSNVDKAVDQLRWCVDFRTEIEAWFVEPEDVKAELQLGKFYCRSTDHLGHPVLVYKCRRADHTLCPNLQMRALIMCLDALEKQMDQGCYAEDHTWVVILDMLGKAQKGSPTADYFMKLTKIFVKCYPCRLHRLFIVDANAVFRTVWRLAHKSKLIDQRTVWKVSFPCRQSSPGNQIVPELVDCIGYDALEVEYGGNDTFQWDEHQHWNVLALAPAGGSMAGSAAGSIQASKAPDDASSWRVAGTITETGSTCTGNTSWYSAQTLDLEGQVVDTSELEQRILADCQALRSRLASCSTRSSSSSGTLLELERILHEHAQADFCPSTPKGTGLAAWSPTGAAEGLSVWRHRARRRLACVVALSVMIFVLLAGFPIVYWMSDCPHL